MRNQEAEVKRRQQLAEDNANKERERIKQIKTISREGGTSMFLSKGSHFLGGYSNSRLHSEDKKANSKRLFFNKRKSLYRINLNPTGNLLLNGSSNLESKADKTAKDKFELESKALGMRAALPRLEFAENSFELGPDEPAHLKISAEDKNFSRLFKGFEIANVHTEMAFSDSPYAKHLENKSPRVKNRLKQLSFN